MAAAGTQTHHAATRNESYGPWDRWPAASHTDQKRQEEDKLSPHVLMTSRRGERWQWMQLSHQRRLATRRHCHNAISEKTTNVWNKRGSPPGGPLAQHPTSSTFKNIEIVRCRDGDYALSRVPSGVKDLLVEVNHVDTDLVLFPLAAGVDHVPLWQGVVRSEAITRRLQWYTVLRPCVEDSKKVVVRPGEYMARGRWLRWE